MSPFVVAPDPNQIGNGDLAVRTDKGRLVALVYAQQDMAATERFAQVVASALCSAFAPTMTDMMVPPGSLDAWLEQNPLPPDLEG